MAQSSFNTIAILALVAARVNGKNQKAGGVPPPASEF
jgi:hypothetical protein